MFSMSRRDFVVSTGLAAALGLNARLVVPAMLVTNQHADVYNLMGFSLRKTGDYKQAYTFYKKALDFDPQHKGALEYLGELYVETGQVEKAKENVALLQKICPAGCEELEDLQEAIAQAPKTN